MVGRYFILSGIPMSEKRIFDEIRNMIQYLVKHLQSSDWDVFEFITEKIGRRGPSKKECIEYYTDK